MATSPAVTEERAVPQAIRVQWIDATRGLAILLVVFGHAAGGVIDSAGPGMLGGLRTVLVAVYTFHMPLFFVLSGLFVEQRMAVGARRFLAGLIPSIVYPYFLWSIIQVTVIFALGALVNHPPGHYATTMLSLAWQPVAQYWFLHALFLIQFVALVSFRVGGKALFLAVALALKLFVMFVPTPVAINLAASNAPYYALGALFGWRQASLLIARLNREARCLIIAAALAIVAVLAVRATALQPYVVVKTASAGELARLGWIPLMLPATLAGGLALALAADSISRWGGRTAALTEYLGKMTMPIYLLHVLFIAGTRILLDKLLGVRGVAILPLLVLAGVAGPVLVRAATDRFRLTPVLALR